MLDEDNLVSVFGGTGFVGSRYINLYKDQCILVPRGEHRPLSNNVLYFISTVDNYNVYTDIHIDIETNLNVLMNVLSNINRDKEVVLNFVSSWFVYGKVDKLPVSEDAYCDPRGFYSITKRAAEQLLISYCETFNIPYRILRLCNVYGVSDNKVSTKRNALQHLTRNIVLNKNIDLYNEGSDIRDFMYVDDVCRAIDLVIKNSRLNDIINIGSGTGSNFFDMMNYVKKTTKSCSKISSISPPDFHNIVQVKDMILDVSKLAKLGFENEVDIYSGLDILIGHYKKDII
jgi:nucleoside-diphosphate-sugar epimerase